MHPEEKVKQLPSEILAWGRIGYQLIRGKLCRKEDHPKYQLKFPELQQNDFTLTSALALTGYRIMPFIGDKRHKDIMFSKGRTTS